MDAREKHHLEYNKVNGPLMREEEVIESLWKTGLQNGFTNELNKKILHHCSRGQVNYEAFHNWKMEGRKLYRGRFFPLPNDSVVFKRAAMIYEKEGRYSECITICEKALQFFQENDWYSKKIEKLKKKLSESD